MAMLISCDFWTHQENASVPATYYLQTQDSVTASKKIEPHEIITCISNSPTAVLTGVH